MRPVTRLLGLGEAYRITCASQWESNVSLYDWLYLQMQPHSEEGECLRTLNHLYITSRMIRRKCGGQSEKKFTPHSSWRSRENWVLSLPWQKAIKGLIVGLRLKTPPAPRHPLQPAPSNSRMTFRGEKFKGQEGAEGEKEERQF